MLDGDHQLGAFCTLDGLAFRTDHRFTAIVPLKQRQCQPAQGERPKAFGDQHRERLHLKFRVKVSAGAACDEASDPEFGGLVQHILVDNLPGDDEGTLASVIQVPVEKNCVGIIHQYAEYAQRDAAASPGTLDQCPNGRYDRTTSWRDAVDPSPDVCAKGEVCLLYTSDAADDN